MFCGGISIGGVRGGFQWSVGVLDLNLGSSEDLRSDGLTVLIPQGTGYSLANRYETSGSRTQPLLNLMI